MLTNLVELETEQRLFDLLRPRIDLMLCHACLVLFCLNCAYILFCSLLYTSQETEVFHEFSRAHLTVEVKYVDIFDNRSTNSYLIGNEGNIIMATY